MTAIRPIAFAAAVVAGGCTIGPPVEVDSSDRSSVVAPRTLEGALAPCRLVATRIDDRRPEERRAGDVHGRTVDAPALTDRVRATLRWAGVETAPDSSGRPVVVELLRAYGYGKSTSMAFTTVLRGELDGQQIIARGNDTGANWANGQGEIARGLLRSVDRASTVLIEELDKRCRRK